MSEALKIQGDGTAAWMPGIGTVWRVVKEAPAGGEVGFSPGSMWLDYVTGVIYRNDGGNGYGKNPAASWVEIGTGSGPGVPSGLITPYGGQAAPSGWLACDGSAVSRATYATLFAVIGTTFGAGDGVSTFNLPNISGTPVTA